MWWPFFSLWGYFTILGGGGGLLSTIPLFWTCSPSKKIAGAPACEGIASHHIKIRQVHHTRVVFSNFLKQHPIDEDIPRCLDNLQCLNEGTCLVDLSICCCPDGYEGERCGENVDECASNPCPEGSTCFDDIASYICICADGKKQTLSPGYSSI